MLLKLGLTSLAGLTAFALSACNSTTDSADSEPTKAKALVGKDWHLVAYRYEPGLNISGETITDNFVLLSPCVTDGKARYSADNTFLDDEGPSKCEADNHQTNSGKWSFNQNQTALIKTYSGGSSEAFTIETLNDTSLVISKLDSTLGDEETHKVTFGYSSR